MADSVPREGLSGRVSGILDDAQNLARETADLFRQMAEGLHKPGRIGSPLIAGAGVTLVGAVLMCLMLVHLLAWGIPSQPMWVSYAAIGIPVACIGIALLAVVRGRMKTLDPLQEQSAKVMREATETVDHVGHTIESARQSLHDTVESVREAIDLKEQFNKRPWMLIAGAASLGYLSGALVHDDDSPRQKARASRYESAHYREALAHLAQQFEPEMIRLKGLALGALFGIVRDLATKSAPQPIESELEDVINGITIKLGGTPVRGPVLSHSFDGNGSLDARRQHES